ncbi:hypothetical protein V1511DRAFT_488827 [Dipodascopsis uninucleata]
MMTTAVESSRAGNTSHRAILPLPRRRCANTSIKLSITRPQLFSWTTSFSNLSDDEECDIEEDDVADENDYPDGAANELCGIHNTADTATSLNTNSGMTMNSKDENYQYHEQLESSNYKDRDIKSLHKSLDSTITHDDSRSDRCHLGRHHQQCCRGDTETSNKKKRKIPTGLKSKLVSEISNTGYAGPSVFYYLFNRRQAKSQLQRRSRHLYNHLSHLHFSPLGQKLSHVTVKDSTFTAPSLKAFLFSCPSPISASIQYAKKLMRSDDTSGSISKPQFAPTFSSPDMSRSQVNARPKQQTHNRLSIQNASAERVRRRHSQRPRLKSEPVWICQFCEFEDIFGVRPLFLMKQYDIKEKRERRLKAERKRLLERAKMKGKKGRQTIVHKRNSNSSLNHNVVQHPMSNNSEIEDVEFQPDSISHNASSQESIIDRNEHLSDRNLPKIEVSKPLTSIHKDPDKLSDIHLEMPLTATEKLLSYAS